MVAGGNWRVSARCTFYDSELCPLVGECRVGQYAYDVCGNFRGRVSAHQPLVGPASDEHCGSGKNHRRARVRPPNYSSMAFRLTRLSTSSAYRSLWQIR